MAVVLVAFDDHENNHKVVVGSVFGYAVLGLGIHLYQAVVHTERSKVRPCDPRRAQRARVRVRRLKRCAVDHEARPPAAAQPCRRAGVWLGPVQCAVMGAGAVLTVHGAPPQYVSTAEQLPVLLADVTALWGASLFHYRSRADKVWHAAPLLRSPTRARGLMVCRAVGRCN